MISKFRTAGSLGLVLGIALGLGCTSIPLKVEKTNPDDPVILQAKNVHGTKRVIFLSPEEAKCPTRCSTIVEGVDAKYVTRIEQRLQEKGYNLISGSIVSRIEDKLLGGKYREEWDRTEKALLLGEETGADAIFEVRSLYIDEKDRYFLKERRTNEFLEKPEKVVDIAISEWRHQKPTRGWLWIPIFGWGYYYLHNDPPSRYKLPVWEMAITVRLIDLEGNVIWSGSKNVSTTDIIPHSWRVSIDAAYPNAQVARTFFMGEKEQNFEYFNYYHDTDLLEEQYFMLIDSLMAQLPSPS